jgi:serine/threonine protein kinase/Flp pilus assembly protein TadD
VNTAVVSPLSEVEELVGRIADEFTERLNRGEQPEIEEYAARHPDIAELLRQVLPALELIRLPGGTDPGGGTLEAGVLGDYRILGELGRGGMGVVYKAEQISLGRIVALKVLPFAGALDSRQLLRFQNEARAAACLHHPNIVPVFAIGCERAVHFYAMQYIEGESLEMLLQEMRQTQKPTPPVHADDPDATIAEPRPANDQAQRETLREPRGQASTLPSPKQKLAYFRRIAELGGEAARALDYAHEVGVIHRDIKPANLMLDGHGKLWVTDFGLAQIRTDTRLTMTGDLVGTLRYMSPEQALAKRVVVDQRTDVYSLGATLYELLALAPVFNGDDRQELLRQIAFEEPKPLRGHSSAIPRELETVVLKALEKNPADRYPSAREFADDLQRFARDEPIRARRPTVARRVQNWRRRHKAVVWSTLAIFLILAGAVGWRARDAVAHKLEMDRQRSVIESEVAGDLEEADADLKKENWDKVDTSLQRAKGRLAGQEFDALEAEVDRRVRNLNVVARLEEARSYASPVYGSRNLDDKRKADRLFSQVFADLGLKIGADDVEETARRVRASVIRTQLLTALDCWAKVKDQLTSNNGRQLRDIAQSADEDLWRQQLRNAVKDRPALERLLSDEEMLSQPPATILLLYSLLGTAPKRLDAEAEIRQGELLLRQAQLRYPSDFWINYTLATHLTLERQYSDAVGFYRAALAVQPHRVLALDSLGVCLWSYGKLPQAVDIFQACIKRDPGNAEAHHHLGGVLLDQEKLSDAETALVQAVKLDPNHTFAYELLGQVCSRLGKHAEAMAAFQKVIDLDPKRKVATYRTIGNLLRQKGDLSGAIDILNKAIALSPKFAGAYNDLGVTLEAQQNYRDAIVAYEKAIKLNPRDVYPQFNISICLGKQGKFSDAADAARKSLERFPNEPLLFNALGLSLLSQRIPADAERAFQQAIALDRDFADAHYNLGITLQHLGKFADGLASLAQAQKLGSQRSSPELLREAKQFVSFDARLPKLLTGETQPADAEESLALARFCELPCRRLTAASARFYREAFAANSELTGVSFHRYSAACAAALAGSGVGKDAANLDVKEQSPWRQQALAWLRDDLNAKQLALQSKPGQAHSIAEEMRHWQQDADFADVRGEALAELPEVEHALWRRLWDDVADLERLAASAPRDRE